MSSLKKAKENLLKKAGKRLKRRKRRHEDYVKEQREIGLGELEQKIQNEELLKNLSLTRNQGETKMSVVLGEFVRPYIDMTETQEQYENMLGMAVLAWNIALQPQEERRPTLAKILQGVNQDPEYQNFFRKFVGDLIARKLEYFDEYKRRIIEFHVRDLGDQYHISVASSLD